MAQPTRGVRASMTPKMAPVRRASENFGRVRAAPLLTAAAKASVDMAKAITRVEKKVMGVSTVIDGAAGCAWRTFRIRRFAPALVSASAILRRGWPEGGRNPWTSVRKIKHAGENAGLPPQCAVLRGARPALTATLSISCRFPAGTLGLARCCAIMAGFSESP